MNSPLYWCQNPASQLQCILCNTNQGGLVCYPRPPWRGPMTDDWPTTVKEPVIQNTLTDERGPLPMTVTATLVPLSFRCYPTASAALHNSFPLFSPREAISTEAVPPAASAHRDSSTNSFQNCCSSPQQHISSDLGQSRPLRG